MNNSGVSTNSIHAYEVRPDVDAKFCSADIRCRLLYYSTTKHLKMQLSPVDEFCFFLFPVISWELLVERRFPVAFCTRIAKRTIRRVFDALVAAADASVMS